MSENKTEKLITEIDLVDFAAAVHVVSEPGDMTRYDYYVIVDGDDYIFFTVKNTFNYPRRLNYFDIAGINVNNEDHHEKIYRIAEKQNCNPYTAKECIKTIQEMQ